MTTPDTLARLRAANPVATRQEDGRGPVAQAALARILADTVPAPRRRRVPRGLALVAAALVVGAGGAVAATDPFGWRSGNPDVAKYGVNPAVHVRTPSAQDITCTPAGSELRCRPFFWPIPPRPPRITGQVYQQIDVIRAPTPALVTRAHFLAALSQSVAHGRATAAQAARFRADLSRVPDSFFTELRLAMRYSTYGGGDGRVPPPGIPEFLVCEDGGRDLVCQNLNGDEAAPVGAGVYMAQLTRAWRRAPAHESQAPFLPPGISFTRAEYRVLRDTLMLVTVSHSSSGPHPPAVRSAPPAGAAPPPGTPTGHTEHRAVHRSTFH